jgi:hypothetical protein
MRRIHLLAAALLAIASVASGQQPAAPAPRLIDHLVGAWILSGTIDGKQTTHDVEAQWVLNHGYVQMHEVSREKDAKGAPAYEATVFISVDEKSGEYTVLWLDVTGNGGLSANGLGRGTPTATTIPFLFKTGGGAIFHNSFIYTPATDTWQWVMDDESGGKLEPFARVTLTRAQTTAPAGSPLAPLAFLLGTWDAVPDATGATGHCTFALDLQNRAIVRTNHSVTPGAGGQPASAHDDLMAIYAEGSALKADYYDSESHVIRYVVSASGPNRAVFLAEATAGSPGYRLTYWLDAPGLVKGQFEFAQPGKPGAFTTYLSWAMKKR